MATSNNKYDDVNKFDAAVRALWPGLKIPKTEKRSTDVTSVVERLKYARVALRDKNIGVPIAVQLVKLLFQNAANVNVAASNPSRIKSMHQLFLGKKRNLCVAVYQRPGAKYINVRVFDCTPKRL